MSETRSSSGCSCLALWSLELGGGASVDSRAGLTGPSPHAYGSPWRLRGRGVEGAKGQGSPWGGGLAAPALPRDPAPILSVHSETSLPILCTLSCLEAPRLAASSAPGTQPRLFTPGTQPQPQRRPPLPPAPPPSASPAAGPHLVRHPPQQRHRPLRRRRLRRVPLPVQLRALPHAPARARDSDRDSDCVSDHASDCVSDYDSDCDSDHASDRDSDHDSDWTRITTRTATRTQRGSS